MKKLLNTLYVTQQKSYLHKERDTIVIKKENQKLAQFPAITIGHIMCFGQISVSPFLMGYCAEQGIGLVYYTEFGRFLARIEGKKTGNVLLRRQQYRIADDPEKSLAIAKLMIGSKIANARKILLREVRNHGDNQTISKVVEHLASSLRSVKISGSNNILMGVEGDAANQYFSVFNDLIRNKKFAFNGRFKRPAVDPVNALLSFVYSLITQECVTALQGVGLDPFVGVLHCDRPGRPSLALDLVEEFRSYWADRFVLTLLNRQQIKSKDFVVEASGAVRLTDEARKDVLTAYQDKKQDMIEHPYLKEKISIGLLPHCQALLLARHLRGDTECYPPFLVK